MSASHGRAARTGRLRVALQTLASRRLAAIGDAGLYHGEEHVDEVELGYALGRPWWGQGHATEAAACLDAAFNVLALETVTAIADPANPASARVLDKLGMQLPTHRQEC